MINRIIPQPHAMVYTVANSLWKGYRNMLVETPETFYY